MTMSHSQKMGRISAVACLTVLALLAQGCTRNPNVRKVKYLNSGKAYAAKGKEKEAIIQFSNAIKIDPRYADAHFELAQAYLKTGSAMGAYTELRRTVELDPKNVQARLDLGQMLLAGHAYEKSLEQANAILAIDPKNADAWGLKSGIAMANHDRAEALKDVQQALQYDPNRANFHAQLGLIQGSDPATQKDAEAQVEEAVKLDPKNAPARLLLAGMLQHKGDMAGAIAQAQAATQADPKNVRAWIALASLYYQSGNKQQAESTLMQATDVLHDSPEGASLLSTYYRQTGQMNRAAPVYADLVNKYPKSVPMKLAYAELLTDEGDYAKAQGVVDQLNKTNSEDPQVQALTGMMLLHAGKVNDALTVLQKGAKNYPDNLALKFWLGEADKAKGDIPGAEQNFRAVTQANPGNLLAQRELAGIAASNKDNPLLEQIASTLITKFPNLADGYLWRAVAEVNQNQPGQAEADLQTALQKNPKDSAALVALGEMRFQQKKYPEGADLLQRALDADPNQVPALHALVAYDLFQLHQPDKALALVQQDIAKSPNNSALYQQLSGLQLVMKDFNGALNSAQKAMQLNPNDGDAVIVYTRAETAAGNAGAAISKWKTWAAAHPNEAGPDVILGTLEEAQGNQNAAMDYYKKALVIQPDQAVAQNNLAFLMLDSGQDVDTALSLAESARRAMPNSPNTADTLAWAYYYKGIYGSARDLLENAEKTDPNDVSIEYHLGMVYSKMGKKADAIAHLKKAVTLGPQTQSGKDASKALTSLG